VTPKDYAKLSDLVRRHSGIVLTPGKSALAKSRLKNVVQRFGFRDTAALMGELPYPSEELARAITEAMTTNETSFFRDRTTFEFLMRTALPMLVRARAHREARRLRIWCAAASTGQEAYSVAAAIEDAGLPRLGWKIDLIATDLHEGAVARARDGFYATHEIERGLPKETLYRYFAPEDGQWRASDRVRRMIAFRTFNLLDHFGWLGEMDIVLCRNVLLYLDPGARAEILAKLAETLAPDGYLFLGASERASDHFASAARGVYTKARVARRMPLRLAV
jgi:chemotaxis protein methyltransferase CheR